MAFDNLRQIEANRTNWKRISRREAVECCRRNRVLIVHREKGVDVASDFGPQSRFYSGSGPYPYSTFKYFLYLGSRQKDFVHNAAAGDKASKPFDPFDASLYTPLDEVEPAKLYPIVFELKGANGKPFPPTAYELTLPDGSKRTGTSGADGFIRQEFNRQPGQAKLKLLPEPANDELPSEPEPNPEPDPVRPEPEPIGEKPEPTQPLPEKPEPPEEEPLPTEPGYRPGYQGTEDKASSPALLDFKQTETLIKDLSEDDFRKAFVDAAKVMDDLGLNRTDGEDRAQAYLDMVTWDPATRQGWANNNTINTSSCGMFVRNIWWLCGARGTPLFDAPYKSGVLTDLLRFDNQASRQWGSEFTAKTFLPKPGDVIYLYNPANNAQHIFIIGSMDKKIVDENGVATVYNDDGTLASELTFTSVDGGQADGFGPDGKGVGKKWGCQAIRKCERKMKLNKGQFMNLGKGWPFPDGTLGRPVNTWISIWAAKDKFTAPLIKPVRAGAGGATVNETGDHSLYHLRIEMDPKALADLDEKFVLTSTDGSFEMTRTAKDDLIEGDNFIDLEFSGLPMNLSYSMKIIPTSGDPYFLYQNVPFDKLNGYMPS